MVPVAANQMRVFHGRLLDHQALVYAVCVLKNLELLLAADFHESSDCDFGFDNAVLAVFVGAYANVLILYAKRYVCKHIFAGVSDV